MLIYGPLAIGIVIGVVLLVTTIILKKRKVRGVKVPAYIGLIISIFLIYLGFIIVRGFEGVAYAFLGIVTTIFTLVTFIIAYTKN